MKNQKLTSPLFWAACLSALKVVLDTIGIQVISDQQIDTLANGIAVVVVIVGIFVDHGYRIKQPTAQDVLDVMPKLIQDIQTILTPPTAPLVASQPVSAPVPIPVSPAPAETPVVTSGNVTNPDTTYVVSQ